ncbi:MAG: HAMP domain-containing histidine kinase [Pseudomonadales bacterium]|nr:HAMP domain-containing histidine kinase [Pseudomonadales bacterium]
MGKDQINQRFGIRAQLMALLILFFILLVFFTSVTVREQLRDLRLFRDQQQLLSDSIKLHELGYLLYKDRVTWQTETNKPAAKDLLSLKTVLLYLQDSSKQSENFSPFNQESIEKVQGIARSDLSLSHGEMEELLLDLQSSSTNTHSKNIEQVISLNPLKELETIRNLVLFTHLHYKQRNLVKIGLLKQVNLRILFELLELAQLENKLRKRIGANSSGIKYSTTRKQLSTESQVQSLIEKQQLLTELRKQLGYQGFIHYFKNMVLRGPEKYEKITRHKVLDTIRLVDTLSGGHKLNAASRHDLITIRSVILDYANKIEIVIAEWKKGTPIGEIDKLVRVDDIPAATALERLHSDIYDLVLQIMVNSFDQRIQATHQATSETYLLAQHFFEERYKDIQRKMLTYLFVSVVGSIILLIIVASITQRIISRIEHIKKVLHHMETYTDLNIRASENGNDEIGDIAVSLNNAIKHRSEIEESLANQTKKSQQAAQARMRFLSGMSHEMKTPLNSIIGYSQRLMSKSQDTGSREYEALKTIHQNGNQLLNRITHILKLVDIDNTLDLGEKQASIAHLHQSLVAKEEAFPENKLNLIWEAPTEKIDLVGTPEAANDIITHLCDPDNFPSGSSISVKGKITDGYCTLTVTFEDAETDLEQVNSLFNETQGLVNLSSQRHEGSNLNMAIIKTIIEKLDGKITAKLKDNEVTYLIQIPCA